MDFQIQIKIRNWHNGSKTVSKKISLTDIQKYADLIKIINKNENNFTWNWWSGLPELWTGGDYEVDVDRIKGEFKERFNSDISPFEIIDFYNKFTPNGGDAIDCIKIFKVEEIEL